jgi:hypothetical protein
MLTKPREQPPEARSILGCNGIYFHAKAATVRGHMADFGFCPNLPLLYKKVEAHQFAFFFAGASLKEQAAGTQITNSGDIAIRRRFPVDPNVFDGGYSRRPSAGGAGC